MHAGDDVFRAIFNGHSTYSSFSESVNGRPTTQACAARRLVDAILPMPVLAEVDVHSAFIKSGPCKRRFARWVIRKAPEASDTIFVLFAAQGITIYRTSVVQTKGAIRVWGGTDGEILLHMEAQFGRIAHVAWGVAKTEREDAVIADESRIVTRLKVELAASVRLNVELSGTGRADVHALVVKEPFARDAVRSFSTYDREIRGISYEFSDDFRPDLVSAAHWDANLLYRYLNTNKWERDCIFPRIVDIINHTPRFDTNCDFGVVFEHPKTGEEVFLDMCRAFAMVCDEYRKVAREYEIRCI